jgi:O-acetyl-ADP-ribose deacetylase (regulator of RNase III)
MKAVLEVIQGDITQTDTDAIVNAANNHFWMGSGVAGAIKRAGGEVIEQEAVAKGPKLPGEAVFTSAGKLRFKYVIHAAAMGQDLRTSDKLIRQASVSALRLADQLKCESVALPAFGTGVGGFPIPACANLMVSTARGFAEMAVHLRRIQFCVFDDAALVAFRKALDKR